MRILRVMGADSFKNQRRYFIYSKQYVVATKTRFRWTCVHILQSSYISAASLVLCAVHRDSYDLLSINILVRTGRRWSHRLPLCFVLQDIVHHAGGPSGMAVVISVPDGYNVVAIVQRHKP